MSGQVPRVSPPPVILVKRKSSARLNGQKISAKTLPIGTPRKSKKLISDPSLPKSGKENTGTKSKDAPVKCMVSA